MQYVTNHATVIRNSIRILILFFIVSIALPVYAVELKNGYLRVDVNDNNARIRIYTTSGNPEYGSDDNQPLTGDFDPPRTAAIININNQKFVKFGSRDGTFTQPPTHQGNKIIAKWKIDSIEITQIIAFMKSAFSGTEDTVKIKYLLHNTGASTALIGVRLIFDTQLGDRDQYPFIVPHIETHRINTENQLTGAMVGDYWCFWNDPSEPSSFIVSGFIGDHLVHPDIITFAGYARISKAQGMLTEIKNKKGFAGNGEPANSAVEYIWQPKEIKPGTKDGIAVCFGTGKVSKKTTDDIDIAVFSPIEQIHGRKIFIAAQIKNHSTVNSIRKLTIRCTVSGSIALRSQNTFSEKKLDPGESTWYFWETEAPTAGSGTLQISVSGSARARHIQENITRTVSIK